MRPHHGDDASRYRDDAEVSRHWPAELLLRLRNFLTDAGRWDKNKELSLYKPSWPGLMWLVRPRPFPLDRRAAPLADDDRRAGPGLGPARPPPRPTPAKTLTQRMGIEALLPPSAHATGSANVAD